MKSRLIGVFGMGLVILVGTAQRASADVVGAAPPCTIGSIKGGFTPVANTYTIQGTCRSTGSLGSTITFPWRATGIYSYGNNTAKEDIIVDPPAISQPSHPYGKWGATYACPGDPWLTQFYAPSTGRATCSIVSKYVDSPVFKDKSLEEYFDNPFNYQPLTAIDLTQPQRDALLAKRDADLKAIAKAEAEQRRGAEIRQTTPAQMAVGQVYPPTILSPRAGQQFYVHMPVPIRLAPPQGSNANGYVINFQLKDPDPGKNYWIPVWTNISVDASQAQSANGYTGFGPYDAGMAGKFASSPGRWRVNAQVFSPRQSVLSDWVEFIVMPLPANPAAAVRRPLTK